MKIVGKIFAVLYSVIFSLLIFVCSLGLVVTNVFTPSFFKDALKSVDLNELSAKDLGLSDDPNASLGDALADTLAEAGFDKAVAKKIMENEEIKEVAGDVIGKFVNYQSTGEVPQVSKSDVQKVINNPDVKQIIGTSISDADINEMVNEVNNMLKELCEEGGASFGF